MHSLSRHNSHKTQHSLHGFFLKFWLRDFWWCSVEELVIPPLASCLLYHTLHSMVFLAHNLNSPVNVNLRVFGAAVRGEPLQSPVTVVLFAPCNARFPDWVPQHDPSSAQSPSPSLPTMTGVEAGQQPSSQELFLRNVHQRPLAT